MPTWSDADLEARLCLALDIAKSTIRRFGHQGYIDEASPALSFGPEKPLAETAMLLYAASAARARPNVARHIDEIAGLLGPMARSDRVLVDIALHPALAFKFAVPHVLLTKLGYPDSSFETFLQSCISATVCDGHERALTASFERHWIDRLWSGTNRLAGPRPSLRDSVLNASLDILCGLRDDAYAFTHLIFYCTDFGYDADGLRRRRAMVLTEASSLLARYLDAEDYDLAGEVLLSWPLTGSKWAPVAALGFRVLASIEDQAGTLPGGHSNPARLRALAGDARIAYALGTAYHTAYVMGFVCAACLRPGRAPPTRISGFRFETACLRSVLSYIKNDQGHWQTVFSNLAAHEQLALAPFLFDIAIVQTSRRHEYELVREILTVACTYKIPLSPIASQAVELLERIGGCYALTKSRHVTSM